MPEINPLQHLHCLRSRSGIAETVDVWKRTMRLKLKTLWRHVMKLLRMTEGNQGFAVRL